VVASEADKQCRAWPLCGAGLQFDITGANAFTMDHRLTVALLVATAAYAAWQSWRGSGRSSAAWPVAALLLTLAQALIGAGAALAGESALFNSLHVAGAAAAWGAAATDQGSPGRFAATVCRQPRSVNLNRPRRATVEAGSIGPERKLVQPPGVPIGPRLRDD